MPKSYTIRAATEKELERIKEFQDGCPDFGHRNLPDEWTADTLAERSKVLLEYIDEFAGTKFYEDIAYTKGWNDYTDLSITTITRRAQPLVEYVLADRAWLGTDGSNSDCWGGLDAGKEFKFVYVGLIRLLCSVRGIQDDKATWSCWFADYDPTQTGFFGINGCDGDNKCHTVPNPVGPRQPDGHRVAPVVQAKKAVEMTSDSITKHITDIMNNVEAEALVRKLMSEFGIKEQVDTNKELEKLKKKSDKQQRDLDKLRVKSREKTERIKELEEQVEKIPDLLEEERYKEREANERDWVDKEEEMREELEKEVEQLKQKVKQLEEKDSEEETEETEEIEYPDRDWRCMFELGGYNMMRGEMDAEYKKCWGLLLTKKIKTYKEWMDLEL